VLPSIRTEYRRVDGMSQRRSFDRLNPGDFLRSFAVSSVKKVVPSRLKPRLKRVLPINFAWKRHDPPVWPLPENVDKNGLERYAYSLFSQNGEDGILRYLFGQIGFASRQFLEFGFDGTENNSLRLILVESFSGVFIDGSELCVSQFNKAARASGILNTKAVRAFLTLDNLESTIRSSGLPSDIDLLSIDVDGNDYWFWSALTCVRPRIVVIEYNASMGPDRSVTVPYDATFNRIEKHASTFYHGASLAALEKLGRQKGYSLTGCDERGVNAFFVRTDCLCEGIPVTSALIAYRPHKSRLERGYSVEDQFGAIASMPFVEIE